jgi:hypothetical protein
MDIVEYSKKRLIIIDKSPLNVMLGWTFAGAGLILFIFLFVFKLDKPEYLPFGIFLFLAGGLLLYFARETTIATFDGQKNMLEIIRKPILGKIVMERYELDRLSEVEAKEKNPKGERFRFRVEMLLDNETWVPLTRAWQSDIVAYETYPGKILNFLQSLKIDTN